MVKKSVKKKAPKLDATIKKVDKEEVSLTLTEKDTPGGGVKITG